MSCFTKRFLYFIPYLCIITWLCNHFPDLLWKKSALSKFGGLTQSTLAYTHPAVYSWHFVRLLNHASVHFSILSYVVKLHVKLSRVFLSESRPIPYSSCCIIRSLFLFYLILRHYTPAWFKNDVIGLNVCKRSNKIPKLKGSEHLHRKEVSAAKIGCTKRNRRR